MDLFNTVWLLLKLSWDKGNSRTLVRDKSSVMQFMDSWIHKIQTTTFMSTKSLFQQHLRCFSGPSLFCNVLFLPPILFKLTLTYLKVFFFLLLNSHWKIKQQNLCGNLKRAPFSPIIDLLPSVINCKLGH